MGYVTDEEILALFADVDTNSNRRYVTTTLEKDPVDAERVGRYSEADLKALWERLRPDVEYTREAGRVLAAARLEFYRRMRPGEPPSLDNANVLLDNLFYNPRRYDLGRVGRYKLNRRLSLDASPEQRILTQEDLVSVLRELIRVNNGESEADDIDHLGNRRVRAVGEAHPEPAPRGLSSHGARDQGANDHRRAGGGDTRCAGQHQAPRGRHPGVLRRVASCRSSWTSRTRWRS